MADLVPKQDGSSHYLSNKQNKWPYKAYFSENYVHLLKTSLLFLYKYKFSEAYISLNIDLGPIKVLSFLDFADQTEKLWQIYCPQKICLYIIYPLHKNGLTKLINVKCMAIYLKIPYYFYTNLNFQRPISHLILIWDPLNFYHFWTLQIKLSNFDRFTAPPRWIFTLSIQ